MIETHNAAPARKPEFPLLRPEDWLRFYPENSSAEESNANRIKFGKHLSSTDLLREIAGNFNATDSYDLIHSFELASWQRAFLSEYSQYFPSAIRAAILWIHGDFSLMTFNEISAMSGAHGWRFPGNRRKARRRDRRQLQLALLKLHQPAAEFIRELFQDRKKMLAENQDKFQDLAGRLGCIMERQFSRRLGYLREFRVILEAGRKERMEKLVAEMKRLENLKTDTRADLIRERKAFLSRKMNLIDDALSSDRLHYLTALLQETRVRQKDIMFELRDFNTRDHALYDLLFLTEKETAFLFRITEELNQWKLARNYFHLVRTYSYVNLYILKFGEDENSGLEEFKAAVLADLVLLFVQLRGDLLLPEKYLRVLERIFHRKGEDLKRMAVHLSEQIREYREA